MSTRAFILLTVFSFLVLLTGCALSVNPVIPESDAVFDPRLLGSWKEVSGSDQATISRGTANSYEIDYTNDGKTGRFGARLGNIGKNLVLDVWPDPRNGEIASSYDGLLLAAHIQLVLKISDSIISTSAIDPEALLSALKSGKVKMPYKHSTDDELILTGTTEELKKSLATYLAYPKALNEADTWKHTRLSEAATKLPVNVPCFEASAWREADELFRHDPHWIGADVASTVDLGNNRILWLFGDTWIDPSGKGTRKGARMVSNSVAIQTGTNPAKAQIAFYWGKDASGNPDAMFPDRKGESLWFGNGVKVGDRLVLFFSRTIRNTGTGLGFDQSGWTAIMVMNPDDEPSAWQMKELKTPANPLGILVGFAAVYKLGNYIIALGSQNPVKSHPVFAARWPEDEVRKGNLMNPEWWAGDRSGWVADSSAVPRFPLFNGGQSELSFHYDGVSKRFISVQTQGFGPADIMMRAAPSLTGPWTDLVMLYRPPEYNKSNIMIYAAKAHPELTGADLALTYVTNSFKFEDHLSDSLIYYPRFVRLTRCR
jgi:hypothetical protein